MHFTSFRFGASAKALVALGIVGAAGVANAATLVIDDFTTGPYSVVLTANGSMATAFQDGTMLGDTRVTRLFVEANPLNRDISLVISDHFAVSDSGTLADSWVRLGYGYRQSTSGGLEVDELNENMTGHSAFQIDFLANDLTNDVKVYAGTWNGASLNLSTATAQAIGGNAVASSLLIPMTSFTGTADFSDIDVIVFEFDNMASGDFALSSVSAVPEPATLMAIGVGITGLLARRKRNKA